ncbi:MAG: hypothetical protein NTV10_02485 [Methanoregula sp.]|nr:hypothetical protein [Methanoregula sp.]
MISPNPVIDVAAIGLTPIFPVISVVPVVVIPVFVRITKLPAFPRSTVEAPITPGIIAAVIRQINAKLKTMEKIVPPLFFILVIFYLLDGYPSCRFGIYDLCQKADFRTNFATMCLLFF